MNLVQYKILPASDLFKVFFFWIFPDLYTIDTVFKRLKNALQPMCSLSSF